MVKEMLFFVLSSLFIILTKNLFFRELLFKKENRSHPAMVKFKTSFSCKLNPSELEMGEFTRGEFLNLRCQK